MRDDPSIRYFGLDDRAELGEPADQHAAALEPPTGGDGTFTVGDAVEALGFGRFQVKLSLLTGMAWVSDLILCLAGLLRHA